MADGPIAWSESPRSGVAGAAGGFERKGSLASLAVAHFPCTSVRQGVMAADASDVSLVLAEDGWATERGASFR